MQEPTNPSPPRFNIYRYIHKALRAFMADTLLRVGRMDIDDPDEVGATMGQLYELLHFCRAHVAHENTFLHPAMEAREPGSASRIAGEHEHHQDDIALLLGRIETFYANRGDRSPDAARMYDELALFVGGNFEHMDYEEREHNPVLWAWYSDAELMTIHDALVASTTPDENACALRWMITALNHAERAGLFAELVAHAPPPLRDGALAMARTRLSEADWHKLAASLELPTARAA